MKHSMTLIGKCGGCGAVNCIAHSKYVAKCEDCGKLYNRYTNYKSLQKKSFSYKRERLLEQIRLQYKEYHQLGYEVPKDIYDEIR